MEGFEKFTKTGRNFKPKISIRKRGQMGFNNGAVNRYKIDDFDFVILYMSKGRDKIAIRLTNDEKEEGAIRIMKKTGNYSFAGKAFLDYYDAKYEDTKSYNLEWDNENEVLIFNTTQAEE